MLPGLVTPPPKFRGQLLLNVIVHGILVGCVRGLNPDPEILDATTFPHPPLACQALRSQKLKLDMDRLRSWLLLAHGRLRDAREGPSVRFRLHRLPAGRAHVFSLGHEFPSMGLPYSADPADGVGERHE